MKKYILVFLMFIGCSNSTLSEFNGEEGTWDHLPITIQRVSEKDQAVIDVYNDFFGQEIFVLVDTEEEADCTVELVDEITAEPSTVSGLTELDWEDGLITICNIKIDNGIGGKLYNGVYAHELGHSLDSPHFETGVMQPDAPSSAIETLSDKIDGDLSAWIYDHYSDLLTGSE